MEAVTFHHSPDHCLASSLSPMPVVHIADILEHHSRSGHNEEGERSLDERYARKYSLDRIAAWRDLCTHLSDEESREDG